MSIEYNSRVPAFLETKPNQFSKIEKKSDCTLKRSSSFEGKSYACQLAPSFCSSWFRGMGGHKLEINTFLFGFCRIWAERSRMSAVERKGGIPLTLTSLKQPFE